VEDETQDESEILSGGISRPKKMVAISAWEASLARNCELYKPLLGSNVCMLPKKNESMSTYFFIKKAKKILFVGSHKNGAKWQGLRS
jgi:hypothetical protein